MADEIGGLLSAIDLKETKNIPVGDQRLFSELEETVPPRLEPTSDVSYAENGSSIPPICRLPIEILEYIFSFLNIKERIRVERVCRQWHWVDTVLPWTWPRTLTLNSRSNAKPGNGDDSNSYTVTDEVVSGILSRCGSRLRRLTLKKNMFAPWNSLRALHIVAECCSNLTQISFIGVPFDVEGMALIGRKCTKLKIVKLHRYNEIWDFDLAALLRGCDELETLELSSVTNNLSGECFGDVSPKLKILRLFSSKTNTEPPMRFDELSKKCDGLQELNLRLNDGLFKMDRKSLLDVMLRYRRTLKTVALESTPWCDVVLVLPSLERLNLAGCRHVHVDFCRKLAGYCVKLSVLDVSSTDVTDEGLTCFVTLPRLAVVDISYTDVLGPGVELLARQGRLQMLFAKDLQHVVAGDLYFRAVAKFCRRLRVLDVCNTPGISNELVRAFCVAIKNGCIKEPVKLNVTGTYVTADVETCDLLKINHDLEDESEIIMHDVDGVDHLFRMYDPVDVSE